MKLRSLLERIEEIKKGSFFSKQLSTANLAISANCKTFGLLQEKLSPRLNVMKGILAYLLDSKNLEFKPFIHLNILVLSNELRITVTSTTIGPKH